MPRTAPAADTGMPQESNQSQLEGALQDAGCMADITAEFVGVCLCFERLEPPKLSSREASLVYWALNQTAHMITKASEAFYANEKERRS